jgi:hypothetical protein
MTWNYRLMAHKDGDDLYFEIHEVYYEKNIPVKYSASPISVGAHSLSGVRECLNKMYEVLVQPVIWAGDRFPEDVDPKEFQ